MAGKNQNTILEQESTEAVVLEMSFWPVERLEKYRGRLSEIR